MKFFKRQSFHAYEFLAGLFITILIISNIASVKMVSVGPFIFDAGTVLFPLAYIVGSIVTEVYGYRSMRSLLYTGIAMLLLTATTFWLVGMLPAQASWTSQGAYDAIFSVVWRIVFASITAIFIGELVSAYLLAMLKIKTNGKKLWGRLVGSTVIGSLVDTMVFSLLAFAGTMSGSAMLQLIGTVFLIKICTEIIFSPLTVRGIYYIKKHEKLDSYEQPAAYLVN